MGMPIITHGLCKSKSAKDGLNKNGEKVVWYNIQLVDPKTYDSQLIGVPKDVYDKCVEGQEVKLAGEFGGLKTKYWKFDKFVG